MANLVTLSGDYSAVEIVGADFISRIKQSYGRGAAKPVRRKIKVAPAPFARIAKVPALTMRQKIASRAFTSPAVSLMLSKAAFGGTGAGRQPGAGTGFMRGLRKSVAAGGVARAGMPVRKVYRKTKPANWRNRLQYLTPGQRKALMKKLRAQRRGAFMMHGTYNNMNYGDIETLSGIGDFLKSKVKFITSPIRSVAKGVGHTVGEVGRGFSRGDIGRVVKAPFKGVGHTVASQVRDVKGHAEWYYRPSKMRQWMKPAGGIVTAAGMIPTPASPFLLAGGAALTAGGAIGEKVFQKKKAYEAVRAGETQKALQAETTAKRNNMLLVGAAGVGVLGLFMALK
jgi:hypothetical protein